MSNSDLTDSLNPDFEEVTKSYGLTVHHVQVGKFHLMRTAGNPSGALTTRTITLPDKCKDGFFLSESGYVGNYRFLVEKNGTQLKITSLLDPYHTTSIYVSGLHIMVKIVWFDP